MNIKLFEEFINESSYFNGPEDFDKVLSDFTRLGWRKKGKALEKQIKLLGKRVNVTLDVEYSRENKQKMLTARTTLPIKQNDTEIDNIVGTIPHGKDFEYGDTPKDFEQDVINSLENTIENHIDYYNVNW